MERDRGQEHASNGGGKCTGDGIPKGPGVGKNRKRISQHCAVFRNRKTHRGGNQEYKVQVAGQLLLRFFSKIGSFQIFVMALPMHALSFCTPQMTSSEPALDFEFFTLRCPHIIIHISSRP